MYVCIVVCMYLYVQCMLYVCSYMYGDNAINLGKFFENFRLNVKINKENG